MNVSKLTGCDGLHARIFKGLPKAVSEPLVLSLGAHVR